MPNADQITYWNESAGPRWVAVQEANDILLRPFGQRVMDAAGVRRGERVLDVGAGCGDTTLELAQRVGPEGMVHAVDISTPMIERARERARDAGLGNITFELRDVQQGSLQRAPFDVAVSRFGIMFFDDPVEAFTQLRGSVVPGGRFAACTWRSREENAWLSETSRVGARILDMPVPTDPHAPGPFGLWDRDRTMSLLDRGGWRDVVIQPFDVALQLGSGSTVESAVDFIVRLGPIGGAMANADASTRARVLAALHDVLAPYLGPGGVVMPGAAWLITATA